MHDIKWIREHPDQFDHALLRRGLPPQSAELLALDEHKRSLQTQLQSLQNERNQLSKQIGTAKGKGENADALMARVAEIKEAMEQSEAQLEADALSDALMRIPNMLEPLVPEGADENANQEIRRHGEPRSFLFEPKDHVAIGEALGMMDFEVAAKMSGSRFVVLSGALARLERALAQFMLDLHTKPIDPRDGRLGGYTEVSPPALVRANALFGTGQLPKFEDDLFKTTNDYYLIPTSEVSLTNMVADTIQEHFNFMGPLRYAAHTPCFRSEAGSAGKDTRGMIRQHQFTKVELVSICKPDQSEAEHERMIGCAEEVLKQLKLPYRVLLLCSGDTGFSAQKTYDLEVWLPAQQCYREISSCSNTGAFQARRMKARYKTADGKNEFVHTLNGSGVAVGRALVAVIENYQQEDGLIAIPDVLKPYMGGLERIAANG